MFTSIDQQFFFHTYLIAIESEFIPKLRTAGLRKMTGTKIWNNTGEAVVGWIFEYEDSDSFKKCQEIFSELSVVEENEVPVRRQAFRGVVFDEEVL